jgi:hypothetical protein
LTARGIAGGRAGENVDDAVETAEKVADRAAKCDNICIMRDADLRAILQCRERRPVMNVDYIIVMVELK